MKAIIIEDEIQLRKGLKLLLSRLIPNLNILAEADAVSTGYACIEKHQPEVLFLDIQINEGSSFDILEQLKYNLPNYQPKIIFITAYQQFAVKAFKYSALDYILKPIDEEELCIVLEKLKNTPANNPYPQIDLLLQHLKQPETKKIALIEGNKTLIVPTTEIIRLESNGNYSNVYLKDKRKILTTKTLKDYEELLQTAGFERIHQSHLINSQEITAFSKKENYVEMSCKTQVPVSSKKMDLLDLMIKKITL
ncbi:MAG: LytR/AlgR family response regulator transcription factor [Flavobacterium sp.]